MRIAYLASCDLSDSVGVTKKIFGQLACWRDLGHDIQPHILCPDPRSELTLDVPGRVYHYHGSNKFAKYIRKTACFSRVFVNLLRTKPDVLYVRNERFNPVLLLIMILHRNVVEINDVSGFSLYQGSSPIKKTALFFAFKMQLLGAKAFVFVSSEIKRDPVFRNRLGESLVVPNSRKIEPLSVLGRSVGRSDFSGKRPICLFVGGGSEAANLWHGVDLLLDFAATVSLQLDFYVVGKFAKLAANYTEKNVVFIEHASEAEMSMLYANTDVAIGTVALFRKGLNEASPLKVREALAVGIPVILPYEDTAFMGHDFPWILKVQNEKNSLLCNRDDIVSFCESWRGRRFDVKNVAPFIDASIVESKRVNFFRFLLDR